MIFSSTSVIAEVYAAARRDATAHAANARARVVAAPWSG